MELSTERNNMRTAPHLHSIGAKGPVQAADAGDSVRPDHMHAASAGELVQNNVESLAIPPPSSSLTRRGLVLPTGGDGKLEGHHVVQEVAIGWDRGSSGSQQTNRERLSWGETAANWTGICS